MRHRSGQRKLNITDGAHRIAMLRNTGNALLRHERIKTTLIRAKELRRFIEPLITLSKKPSVANRRLAFARLRDRDSVVKLFDDIGVRFATRPGGYLRILKYGFRAGDNAPMALVELVERREVTVEEEAQTKKAGKNKKRAEKETPTPAISTEATETVETAEATEPAEENSATASDESVSADSADSADNTDESKA